MADVPSLMPFRPDDRFLRRVGLPGQMKGSIVYWRAFKEKEATLSFTFQDEQLNTASGLDAYQKYFSAVLGGNLPGLVWLSYEGLTVRLSPALAPRHDPDSDDPAYGHLHCCTDAPRDKAHTQLLAKLVTDGDFGGVLREFVKKDVA